MALGPNVCRPHGGGNRQSISLYRIGSNSFIPMDHRCRHRLNWHLLEVVIVVNLPTVKNRGFMAMLFGSGSQPVAEDSAIKSETLMRLQELCLKHTFVNVRFVNRIDCSFQSLILKVDPDSQSLLIDEFFPMHADIAIIPGENIEIISTGKGLPIKFVSVVGSIEILDGSPAYRIALPKKIKANQRREYFRVAVHNDMNTRLRINLSGGDMAMCRIINLSSSGVSFSVDKNISERLASNRNLKDAKFTLPDGDMLSCNLEVKSYEYRKPPYRCTVIGARFDNLPRPSQKQLDKLIFTLQRLSRRTASS